MSEEPRGVTKVLLVEDDPRSVEQMRALLDPAHYQLTVASVVERAQEVLRTQSVDLILADQMLAGVDILTFCAQVKATPQTSVIPFVVIGPFESLEARIHALEAGADDYVPRGLTPKALLHRLGSLARTKRLLDQLESTESVVASLAQAVEAKDGYTEAHTERVSRYAQLVAAQVTVTEGTRIALKMGGMLHDVGKIGVPDHILNKPGRLTPDEWEIMKRHPVIGAKICQPLRRSAELVPIVRHHHERLDGSGYPDGLRAPEISLGAQVMSIADFYDACTSNRPYRPAMPPEQAFELLRSLVRARQMDKELVAIFLSIVRGEMKPGAAPPSAPASPSL
jgi:putative two-component system response regulator